MTAPYYQDEHVTLYHGDCRDIAPTLSGIDAVITDPPYGDTSLQWDRWQTGWVKAIPAGVRQMWCFGSFRMFMDNYMEFRDPARRWKYAQDLIWEKHNGSGFAADRFKRVHELIVHWYQGTWDDLRREPQYTNDATARTVRRKARPAHTGGIQESTYTSVDGGPRLMRSVLQARSMHGRAIHPTEKPVGILTPLIRYSTPPGGTVLDMFAGSGSTLAAAAMEGRRSIGIEGDERYCEIAANRLSQGVLDLGGIA